MKVKRWKVFCWKAVEDVRAAGGHRMSTRRLVDNYYAAHSLSATCPVTRHGVSDGYGPVASPRATQVLPAFHLPPPLLEWLLVTATGSPCW